MLVESDIQIVMPCVYECDLITFHSGNTITIRKGHELRLYEALSVIVGPFLIFTIVKM